MTPAAAMRRASLRRIARALTVMYVLVLALIAFWPTPVDAGAHDSLTSLLGWLHAHGAPGWLRYTRVEFLANVALFLPVGLLVVILTGAKRWWLGVLAGLATSCAIELGQSVLLPARFATLDDVVANTAGAAVGALVALVILWAMAIPAAPVSPAAPATPAAPTHRALRAPRSSTAERNASPAERNADAL